MSGTDIKTMALLLIVVIVLSMFGTAAFLSGLGKARVRVRPTAFTTTGTGTATAELSGTVAIFVNDGIITFARGYINVSQDNCTVASNITATTNSSGCCWINDTNNECGPNIAKYNSNTTNSDDNFTLNNTGTVVANLTIKSNCTPAQMFGGEYPMVKFAAGPSAYDGTVDVACNGTLQTAWTDVSTTEVDLCDDWLYTDSDDELVVWVNFTFDRDVVAGEKSATYTFTVTGKPGIN